MDYHRIPASYKSFKTKSKSNSISVSPFGKNISNTYNSSSSKNNQNYNYNNKITSSIDNEEEENDNYKYDLLLKEKNTIIQKLQNQIKKLMFKEEEKDKKIKMQKHIIESLKESNKNLQEELSIKNNIIQQNQNIEKKIFHLQKEYLEESNNSYNNGNNNLLYFQSIKEYMNKLNEKENEINNYKKRINILKINLQKKENELIKKNKILIQYQRNQSGSLLKNNYKNNNNIFYEKASLSAKKAKSMKNYSNEISSNNFKLKEDLKQINIRTNKPNLYENNNNNYNYNKLLENYNDIKTKCNYYYKLAHHLKSKNNKFIEEIQKLRSNLNVSNNANINLKKILNRPQSQYTKNNISKKNQNINNINNIRLKSNNDLISDDEKDNNININNNNNNFYNNNTSIPKSDNMAVKKLYEALEKYRELYNQKEKECEDKEKTIESLNSLHNQITEYLTIIDEIESSNKSNEEIINKLQEKIKILEKNFNEEKKRNELLIKKNDKLNKDNKDKENKIKKLMEELKDKEILIKEEQINTLIKINSAELKQEQKEDFNKKINELQTFITKIKKELSTNKSEFNKLTEENIFLKKKLKEKNDELDEKNITIDEIIKKLNDQEIQYKGVKYDNQELIQNAKQRLNDMKQKELKINQLLIENENIKKNNQILNTNKQLFIEEKNKLINNYNLLTEELNTKKQNTEYLQTILIQKTELIDKLQKNNNDLIIELNNTKNELKQKKIELNQFEVQYNKLKQEKNISKELINLVEENNKIILQNESLQNKLDKLTQENNDINIQLNEMNKKYQDQKKLIQEKDIELINMKEASKAILEKHKKIMEEKTQKYDPNFYNLISTKKYNKLTWYLLQKKFEQKNNINIYDKFIWVNGDTITKAELSKFNKIEDDDQKMIKDLQDFNYNLQKKLERKEESINILDYKNKKLMEQIQNKTFANTGNNKLKFNLGKNDNTIKNNINGSMGERGFESEKFKNILQQLNYSNLRETKLQNEVKNLKEKLKKKEEFEAGFPKHFKDIEPSGNDSGFLDDDLREQEKKCIFDLVKSDDRDKLSTKKSDTNNYNENNEDFRKLKEEIIAVKNRNKDLEVKYKNLEDMVKDLIKNVKYENNIKPHIVQICQILGYSPQTTQKIVKSKISGLKNFVLK